MNRTTVPSNNKKENKVSIAGHAIYFTENTLEVPKDGNKVYEAVTKYVEEQGNIEIPVGNAKVNENGTLQMENGNTISMKNPNAYKNLIENKEKKAKMQAKVSEKVAAGKENDR